MKKIITLLLLVCTIGVMASEPVNNDTLVVEKPRRVTVISGDSIQQILIEGKQGNDNYSYQSKIELVDSNYTSTSSINSDDFRFSFGPQRKKDESRIIEGQSHWLMGINTAPGMPREADIHMIESTELWWIVMDMMYQPWKNPHHKFSIGIGLDWRTWRMHADKRFWKGEDGQLNITDYPENAEPDFSRIKIFSINFPIRYHYNLGNGCALTFGPVLSLNLKSSIKTKYKLDGGKHKDVQKDIHQNIFTVDLMGTIETPYFGLYYKYTPFNILKSSYGLRFHSFTMGLIF